MRRLIAAAKVLLSAAGVMLVFSLQAVTHDVSKSWRCRRDTFATTYERADACRPESWR